MLGQAEIDSFVAFAVAAAATLIAASRGITFLVDRVRDAVPFGDDPKYKILWGLLALALSLIACLGWGIDPVGQLLESLPNAPKISETVTQVISAITFAGLASSWHDRDVAKNPPLPAPPNQG